MVEAPLTIDKDLVSKIEFSRERILESTGLPEDGFEWVSLIQENLDAFPYSEEEILSLEISWSDWDFERFDNFKNETIRNTQLVDDTLLGGGGDIAPLIHDFALWGYIQQGFRAFFFGNLLRYIKLLKGILECLNNQNLISAAVLARTLLEHGAAFRRHANMLERGLSLCLAGKDRTHNKDLDALAATIQKTLYGSGSGFKDRREEQSATNVLTHINKLSNGVLDKGLPQVYSYLCEYAHPNFLGIRHFSKNTTVNSLGERLTTLSSTPGDEALEAAYATIWILSWSIFNEIQAANNFFSNVIKPTENEVKNQKDRWSEKFTLVERFLKFSNDKSFEEFSNDKMAQDGKKKRWQKKRHWRP